MDNTIIIKIESGVVADVYATSPAQVIVVDYDLIEGDETFESRVRKAVLSMPIDYSVKPEEIAGIVAFLLAACERPPRSRGQHQTADNAEHLVNC